jgi:hypothetical protein
MNDHIGGLAALVHTITRHGRCMMRPMKLQQHLRREDRGRAGVVVVGRDLHEVDAHHLAPRGQPRQKLQHLVVEEAAVGWRAGPGAIEGSKPSMSMVT